MKNKQPVLVDAPPVVVEMRHRVAGMTDAALATLHANAVRLAANGNERQQRSAGALIPAIDAELAERHAKALAAMPRARREAAIKLAERASATVVEIKPDLPPPASEPIGPQHKFALGQTVKLYRTLHGAPIDGLLYEIIRQLPLESIEFQYRIRTKDGRVERVVLESQLGIPRAV